MRYRVERWIDATVDELWAVLSELEHFARSDPYHHDFELIGSRRAGRGARFRVRHTYWPIFPLRPDVVECVVTEWEPGRRLTLLERNRHFWKTHTQRFSLTPRAGGTVVAFEIFYLGVPLLLLPYRLYVGARVRGRMADKLAELAADVEARRGQEMAARKTTTPTSDERGSRESQTWRPAPRDRGASLSAPPR